MTSSSDLTWSNVGFISFAVGALAYAVLFALLVRESRRGEGAFILMAVAATVAWTGASAAHYGGVPLLPRLISSLELLRFLCWIAFLGSLLRLGGPGPVAGPVPGSGPSIGGRLAAPLTALICLVLAGAAYGIDGPVFPNRPVLTPILGLVGAVAGLTLTEILFRSTPANRRWQIKFLCLSAGILFAYDLFLYADAALFGRADASLKEARGAVQALCAPLLAVAASRIEIWRSNIVLSRKVVMGSTTLIASGLYLLLTAAIGFWLREIGVGRGNVLYVIFFVGAMAVLAVILLSGAYWGFVRRLVGKHFFRSRYDWRDEWLRFMSTLSSGQGVALETRCVKAIADVVDSPGGAMYLLDNGRCEQVVSWNFAVPELSSESAQAFGMQMPTSQAVIDLEQARAGVERPLAAAIPEALLRAERAWLVVPLWHRGLVGFVILEHPRAPRGLGWEDYDLLGVIGRQAASYVAEHRAWQALEAGREFEIFNRRFAFVVHDVKNLVSQLSVLGSNFEKHGHRQEFRDDVVKTLHDAAATMKRLMERIHALEPRETPLKSLALEPLIRRVVAANEGKAARLVVDCRSPDLAVVGERDRLEAMIGHLVQNALDAVDGKGTVKVSLRHDGRFAVLDVTDNGPGMARAFVQRELFKPFQSSRKKGMGIGAFQCREYAREFGGNLEAISAPGQGTTMRVTLPIAEGAQG